MRFSAPKAEEVAVFDWYGTKLSAPARTPICGNGQIAKFLWLSMLASMFSDPHEFVTCVTDFVMFGEICRSNWDGTR